MCDGLYKLNYAVKTTRMNARWALVTLYTPCGIYQQIEYNSIPVATAATAK